MWTRVAQTISREQEEEVVAEAVEAMGKLSLAEIRDRARLMERARTAVEAVLSRRGLVAPPDRALAMAQAVAARAGGLGFLEALLPPARTDLSEIAVTPDGKVWVLPKGARHFEDTGLRPSREEVWRAVETLLAPLGRSLSEATPSVDARLPRAPGFSGARIKAIHPAVCPGEFPALNIRLFEARPVTPEQIVAWEMAPERVVRALVEAVGRGCRVLVIGGTATGKTTLLSALCAGIPREARIVKIEDPEEIFLDHPHVVTLEARPAPPGSGIPPYTVRDGVDDAMRMSPNWLIVGEVRRGDAAMALFRAQMSDHPGLSTFHAEGPEEAVFRLAVIMFADVGVRMEAAKAIFAQAVDLVVQVGWRDGRRRILGVWEPDRQLHGGDVKFRKLWLYGEPEMAPITRR
ncbi:MAG: ATPase, T2SS/T4P/T4SS family [Armatimonadota bacterium]|nr:ATPase, T2SS/T4P/T4SS family [Armatimonadota bacterium]